jgi:hypothetical protein
MLTAANLVYFLAHEFAGLRCGCLAFALGLRAFSIVFFSGISGFLPDLFGVYTCSRGRWQFCLKRIDDVR